jgi:predicted transcriptional regulator of viral defense system
MARLAARQHGVVAVTQLKSIGFTAREIEVRARAGRLHRIHRGVYAVGHKRLTIRGHRMGAVLFGGTGTVLSHRPAGAEWGLRRWSGRPAITVPTRRRPSGLIEIHCSSLPADERTVLDGIPITTWPRTLLDLDGPRP